VRVFARNYTHTNKYKYREIREQKEEGKRPEEGISVHEKEWRGEKERDASDEALLLLLQGCRRVRGSTNAFSISTHPPTRPARGERASPPCDH